MAPMIRTLRDPEFGGEEPAMLGFSFVVLESEPDADIPDDELPRWLQSQERAELCAELAAAGLL